MGRLAGKVAVITGAASGIGRSAALLFAKEGARVVLADVKASAGEAAAEEIRAAGGQAIFVETDVTAEQAMRGAVETAVTRFGGLDVLYNNAGGATPRDGKVTEIELDEFWRTIGVDLFGTFLGCRLAIPHMVERGGGSIVNTTSIRAMVGTAGADAYSSAKGGVVTLTRALAMQWAEHRIHVNAIAPGAVGTERVQALMQPDDPIFRKSILGLMEPADIAYLALYLASDESARMTGAVLPVDSGASCF